MNNQSLTQVSQLYVHVSFCLKAIRPWHNLSTGVHGHVIRMLDEHTDKWDLEANNLENFQKVIIDHKRVVSHTTVRGLTKCGIIVNCETNKHSDFFHVLEMDDDNVESDESLSVINMFSDCMNSSFNIWESETKQIYKYWVHI